MSSKLKIALWIVAGIALVLFIVWGVKRYKAALAASEVQKKVDDQLQSIKQQFVDEAAFENFMKNFVAPFKNTPVVVSSADKTDLQDLSKFSGAFSRVFLITQLPSGNFVKRSIGAPKFNEGKAKTIQTMIKIGQATSIIAKDTFDKIPNAPAISFEEFLTFINN